MKLTLFLLISTFQLFALSAPLYWTDQESGLTFAYVGNTYHRPGSKSQTKITCSNLGAYWKVPSKTLFEASPQLLVRLFEFYDEHLLLNTSTKFIWLEEAFRLKSIDYCGVRYKKLEMTGPVFKWIDCYTAWGPTVCVRQPFK